MGLPAAVLSITRDYVIKQKITFHNEGSSGWIEIRPGLDQPRFCTDPIGRVVLVRLLSMNARE